MQVVEKKVRKFPRTILEIGAFFVRYGYGSQPHVLEPNVFSIIDDKPYFGREALFLSNRVPVNLLIDETNYFKDFDILEKFLIWLHEITFRKSWSNEDELLLIVPIYWSFEQTVQFVRFFMEKFDIGALGLLPNSEANAICGNLQTNLLVDIGYSRIYSCYQEIGKKPESLFILPFGAKIMIDHIDSEKTFSIDSAYAISSMKVNLIPKNSCFDEILDPSTTHGKEFYDMLQKQIKIYPGESDSDIKIILGGTVSNLTNFTTRLSSELQKFYPNNKIQVDFLAGGTRMAWIGGQIYSNEIELYPNFERFITQNEFKDCINEEILIFKKLYPLEVPSTAKSAKK